jgi:hypothetical protein
MLVVEEKRWWGYKPKAHWFKPKVHVHHTWGYKHPIHHWFKPKVHTFYHPYNPIWLQRRKRKEEELKRIFDKWVKLGYR